MTDIIQDAKQLLEGATPAPWEPHPDLPKCLVNLETQFAVAVVPDSHVAGSEDESNRNLIAATPALAQALAEETYEYAVQVKCTASKEWRLLSFKLPFITHKTTWFRSQSEAEHQRQEQVSEHVDSRIVRRRVSPPEVINE